MRYDIFISSKSEDYHLAENVYDFLIFNGLSVFFADREIAKKGRAEYMNVICDALDECTHMIVVASSTEHIQSRFVNFEWTTFLSDRLSQDKNGNLVTVLQNLHPHKLPSAFRGLESFPYDSYKDKILNFLSPQNQSTQVQSTQVQSTQLPAMPNTPIQDAYEKIVTLTNFRQLITSEVKKLENTIIESMTTKVLGQQLRNSIRNYVNFNINSKDICNNAWQIVRKTFEEQHNDWISVWAKTFEKSVKENLISAISDYSDESCQQKEIIEKMPSFGFDFCENLYRNFFLQTFRRLQIYQSFYEQLGNPSRRPFGINESERKRLIDSLHEGKGNFISIKENEILQPLKNEINQRVATVIKLIRQSLFESFISLANNSK